MASGTWTAMDKVRAGAYVNFKAVEKSQGLIGNRGVSAICIPLHWGREDGLIEVLSTDLLEESKKTIGLTANDSEAKLLAGMLSYCYKALVFRGNSGGDKASVNIGKLKATAKYSGTFGNKITIAIFEGSSSNLFDVSTYVNGEKEDSQIVSEISELKSNDFVDFSENETGEFIINSSGASLEGGTDGTFVEADAYDSMFKYLKTADWQTLAIQSNVPAIISDAKTFVQNMRENEGRYVQLVIGNDDTSDYEGIINVKNGLIISGIEFTVNEMTAIVAGMTAGVDVNKSNTSRVVDGAEAILNEYSNSDIIKGIKKGWFMFSTSRKGEIRVEKDINSLHTFTKKKTYAFSKNRIIRTLDQIGTDTIISWENGYQGKMDNDDDGRASYKADLIAYGNEAQRKHMIQNFNGTTDITVEKGNDIESVKATWHVQPVDSMEKLYMTVYVNA